MLTCTCSYGESEWYYYPPEGFKPLAGTRRKRCCSCKELISLSIECLSFDRYRTPQSDVEERIYDDEVPLAPRYMCEKCGEIFLNLWDIGYCIDICDDMRDLMAEYWDITGFKPNTQGEQR